MYSHAGLVDEQPTLSVALAQNGSQPVWQESRLSVPTFCNPLFTFVTGHLPPKKKLLRESEKYGKGEARRE